MSTDHSYSMSQGNFKLLLQKGPDWPLTLWIMCGIEAVAMVVPTMSHCSGYCKRQAREMIAEDLATDFNEFLGIEGGTNRTSVL